MATNDASPSKPSGSSLVISKVEGVAVVDFRDTAVLDGSAVESIGRQLYALVDERAERRLLLDLRRVQFLSSRMIGVLTELHKRSKAIKGKVVICGLRPNLHKVFRVMRLDKLLHFAPDAREAMHELAP
jgi:anti-anti-sigma factor